jgi:hypothetical protein
MTHAVILVALALLGSVEPLQPPRVDISGTWKEDHALSRQLTESRGHKWTVAGAGAGGGERTAADDARLVATILTITQTPTQLVFELQTLDHKRQTILTVDGSESVNTSSSITKRSRSSWQGNRLVTKGIDYLELISGDFERHFVMTHSINTKGHLEIETAMTEAGRPDRSRFQVYVRHKQ